MVFESVVTDVLNKVLGDYVVNLDKKQLKIGIWGGDVVLHNLKLRENALDDLNLPVQLVYGYLGSLVLKIPWKNLYGQPVVAEIEDLYLLVAPKQAVQYDEEKEEKYQLQVKQAALQALEDAHKRELEKDGPKPDATFTEKLTAQIVNNLQVKIGNVHIRYEDQTTTGQPFAFGVTLANLEIYTTDANWVRTYLTEQVSRVYKIANLDSLSVYMNCKTKLFSEKTNDEFKDLFRDNIARADAKPEGFTYVLGPISSIAKLQLNMNPQYDDPPFVLPKIDLCLDMQELNVALTCTQFQDIIKLAEAMNRMQLGAPYRKYRPYNIPYKGHYKEWWQFAITAVLEENIRRKNREWTWEYVREHRERCNTYAQKFKEMKSSKKPPASLVETCNLLEQKLDLFNLVLIRQRVLIEVDKKRREEEEKKEANKGSGWFGGWFGGGKKADEEEPSDLVRKFEAAMTEDEKSKLYKAIGYQENAVPPDLPDYYEALRLNFKLVAFNIGLYDDCYRRGATKVTFDLESMQKIMLLEFSMATCSIQQRPAANAISVTAGIKELRLTGLKMHDKEPVLIASKLTDDSNLLDIFFQTNPIDGLCNQRFKVTARPLQIMYDTHTVLHLIKVFSPPKNVNLSELEGAAYHKISDFKERSATGMQYIIENKPILDVDINFMPNILILPRTGVYNPEENSMIVVSLGQLRIVTKPHEMKRVTVAELHDMGLDQDEIWERTVKQAYDQYTLSVNDIQVLVVKPHEDWEQMLTLEKKNSDIYVLRPTSILAEAYVCVVCDDPRLPKTKVDVVLPAITVTIAEDRVFEAMNIVTSIPLPESDTPSPSADAASLLLGRLSNASSKLSLVNFLGQDGSKRPKTPKATADTTLTTELQQYTNLDLRFVLKEFTVNIMKSRNPALETIASSPTDSNAYGTPIAEISSSSSDDVMDYGDDAVCTPLDVESSKILSLTVLHLEVIAAQRTFETVAVAKLGAINLTQYVCVDRDIITLSLIDTPRYSADLEYLLTVSYTMADKTSPEFTTKYQSTEQLINVNFSALDMTLHQEGLLHLIDFATNMQQKLEKVKPITEIPKDRIASTQGALLGKLNTIIEENLSETNVEVTHDYTRSTAVAPRRSGRVVQSIKMAIQAKLDRVGVLLTCRKRPIASLQVEHFNAGVILKSSYTEVTLRLKDIIVNDLNPKSRHTKILSIVGENALNCQVVLYNLDETSQYNSDDMKIDVEIGCMRIIFLNWFVTSVLNFLGNFQAAQQAMADASAAAAEKAKDTALDAYQKESRMKLNIRIKAPVIVVPKDSNSLIGLCLDLGFLRLTNVTSEVSAKRDDENSMAVIDEIKLELKDMKLAKVQIIDESVESAKDSVDAAYGFRSGRNIMDPISFTLDVKRNLSSGWYKEVPDIDVSGKLKSVEFNLFKDDYAIVMSILNGNLNEGADEVLTKPRPPPVAPVAPVVSAVTIDASPSRFRAVRKELRQVTEGKKPDRITEQMKFNFLFDGVIANFKLDEKEVLARFGLYFLSVKGSKLVDGTLRTSIVLCNIQIDDMRKNNTKKIHKLMSRKDWKDKLNFKSTNPEKILEMCQKEHNFILDLTAIIKEDDTYAEVRLCGFELILCIDFVMQLMRFVALPEDKGKLPAAAVAMEKPTKGAITSADIESQETAVIGIEKETKQSKLSLQLHIEEPDIILIENLEDLNANAIIFNMQGHLNYRVIGERQVIKGQIESLKMYMCSFQPERREATTHYIIHPCVISLQGSTPDDEHLAISLNVSDVIINVSPATIELLNKAMQTLSASSVEIGDGDEEEVDYSDIWKQKKFKDKDYWFVKIDDAEDALKVLEAKNSFNVAKVKSEKCVVEVPCITVVVEMGVGYYTTPLIMIDTRLSAVVSNWSRDMSVKGSLSLNMNYYNQELAVWEPIIELNEHVIPETGESEYLPWELNFNLDIGTKSYDTEDDLSEEATKRIQIKSDENLELTLTKTSIDLLSVVTEVFSQAIDSAGLIKPDVIAPYVIENDTGFDVSVDFTRGIFTLHECHMPQTSGFNSTLNRLLVFQHEQSNPKEVQPEQVKHCVISAGGQAFLQTKSLAMVSNPEDEEYFIYAKIGDIDKEIVLPVSKSDVRYFPLYRDTNHDPWGIVSEVRSEYGTTKINIHGVVSVYNHFTTPIRIYRYTNRNENTFVGEVAPKCEFHVPLHAIYADNKSLHFALPGYHTSVQGVEWGESPTDLNYSRQLQCDPISTFETLYINVNREKKEIYYKNTNKFKLLSAVYKLHLRPPLYMRNALPISITVSVAGCLVRRQDEQNQPIDAKLNTDVVDSLEVKEDFLDYGEKNVDPGDCLHLPTVKLSGKGMESKSFLVIRLIQYLEKDWSCTTEVNEDNSELDSWTFTAYDSAEKMEMELSVRSENRYGSMLITLFSPFWMINKTDLMLSYKTNAETMDILYHPPEYKGPILFSFRQKSFFGTKRATIRVDRGEWSNKIPMDVAGSAGFVICKTDGQDYQIGVHNHLTHNSLTKQITFVPFYVAVNKCRFPIKLQEATRPGDPWLEVPANSCSPFWPKSSMDTMIVAKVHEQRTKAFNYAEAQCTVLQLDNRVGGLNLDVQATEGGTYLTFSEYKPGDAPGLLINHCSRPLVYYEKGNDIKHTLLPHHRILYAWLEPSGERCIIFGENNVETDLRRDGVGPLTLADGTKAYWVSFLDGLQRVLLFTEIESIATKSETSSALQNITQSIEVLIHGIGLSVFNNVTGVDILYLGITSSGVIWESKKDPKKRFKQMNIADTAQIEALYQQYLIDSSVNQVQDYYLNGRHLVDFDGMTIVKDRLRPIQRTRYPGVWFSMKTSPYQTQLHAKINKIQLDNQLRDCIFPVVLTPIAPPKSVANITALKPFIECSIVQRVVPHSTVRQYKYTSMLMQEFHFKVDIRFLTAIVELFTSKMTDEQQAKLFNQDIASIGHELSDLIETKSMQEQKNFYDNLHLGPLKIHVSFSMAGSDTSALPGILSTLVNGIGVTLTDVNDVVFRLAFFEREYTFFTQGQLTSEITAHYVGQGLKQLYVLVLGLDVLGDPYGLVVGLKQGVEDLFYEPFQGAIQGPGEFAEGLVLGVKSLFGHTVGGAAGAVSKITGAMGKGLAALTFDEEYQRKRREALNRKPANFHEGIARSSKGLLMGFVDGVTGVVTKPVSGAREDGVEGFFKGLGKGAIGLVARPTAGMVDFASGSFEAVKRAAENKEELKRLRPARFMDQDNVLRPYCLAASEGNKMLKEVEKGKYATTDIFVHSEVIVPKKDHVLLTNHRVMYLTKNDLFGMWAVHWTYLWHEIAAITATSRGVELSMKKEGKKMMGIFSSHDTLKKVIYMTAQPRRDRLVEKMESQRRDM